MPSRENPRQVSWKRPYGLHWAKNGGESEGGYVWINMKPRKILDQFSKGAGTIAAGPKDTNIEFKFLAPLNLNENIVHHWEAYESVASRLAQKVRSAVKLGSEATALLGAGSNINSVDSFKNIFQTTGSGEGQTIETYATKAYNAVPGSKIPSIKVDTPLYYTNSDRRQIVLDFVLFHENIPGTSKEDVLINPIKELMKLSSPHLKSNINIEFPYMWEIKTEPNEFLKYTTCALVGVQPTWNHPYVSHVPSSVNLQLTFMDMSPLYADTIEKGSIVNVITQSQSRALEQQNIKTRQELANKQGADVLRDNP